MHYTYGGDALFKFAEVLQSAYYLSVQVEVGYMSSVAKMQKDNKGKYKFHHTAALPVSRFLNSFFKCCVNAVITICPFFFIQKSTRKRKSVCDDMVLLPGNVNSAQFACNVIGKLAPIY